MKEGLREWIQGRHLVGLHLHLKGADGWDVELVELQRKRHEVKITGKGEGIRTQEDLWQSLPAHSRISLCLSGTGVLLKQVRARKLEGGLEAVLPNVRREEFVVQQIELDAGNVLIAVVRRDLLNELLQQFCGRNLWVIDLWLGPVCMQNILGFLPQSITQMVLPGMEISLSNGKIKDCKKSQIQPEGYYQLAGEDLWATKLLPFAAGLSSLALGQDGDLPEEVMEIAGESFARQVLIRGGALALGLVFVAVLVNFLVFDSLRKEQTRLSAQVETGRNLLVRLDGLRSEMKQKEDFLMKSGLNSQSRLSYYADRLAACLPQAVRLVSLELNPVKGKIREGKEIFYQNGIIRVKGNTSYPMELNRWVQQLKQEEWVEQVEKQEYFMKEKNKPADFEVEISLK